MPDLDIELRPITPAEVVGRSEAVRWALNTWLNSFFEAGLGFAAGVESSRYWDSHHDLALVLLAQGAQLAHMPGSPDLFVGWVCGQPGTLHYVYVKAAYRRDSVADRLLEALPLRQGAAYTHRVKRAFVREWFKRRGWVYDPYALLKEKAA